jgi:Flp pilus assembly protein TadG
MRSRSHERGQALVEFALAIPLLILILLGIFDLGRAVYASSTLNNAAREAGRLAIVDQTITDIQARGASGAVSLGVDAATIDVDFRSPSSPDTADSCAHPSGGSAVGTDAVVGCVAVVTIPYEYTAATPIIGALVGPIALQGEARFPVEFNCVDGAGRDCPIGQ